MPKKTEPSLLVELKPSRRLKRLLVVIHLLALASSLANALPITVKLALLAGTYLHFRFISKRFDNERHKIKHTKALGWEVFDGNNFEPIKIQNSTVITVFAILLHFTKNTKKQSVLIVNDALTEDDYRRLIVRLKTAANH